MLILAWGFISFLISLVIIVLIALIITLLIGFALANILGLTVILWGIFILLFFALISATLTIIGA